MIPLFSPLTNFIGVVFSDGLYFGKVKSKHAL